MKISTTSSLPAIDAVEIVDLRGVDADAGAYLESAHDAPSWRLTGEEAQRIAELWRSLPPGEQSRCHTPPFGFRFFISGRLVAEASVCWRCNNMFGAVEGRPMHHAFDSSGTASQALLAEASAVTGIHPKG